MGRFSEGTRLIAGARTSGHGVVYYLETTVTTSGVRAQSPHSTVNS